MGVENQGRITPRPSRTQGVPHSRGICVGQLVLRQFKKQGLAELAAGR